MFTQNGPKHSLVPRPASASAVSSAIKSTAAWLALVGGLLPVVSSSSAVAAKPAVQGQAVQPILRYRFDDGANPTANSGSLGSAQDGDISTGSPVFVGAGSGQALSMTSSTYVEPNGNENAFDIGDQDFSLYARIRCGAASGGEERLIIVKRDNSRGYSLGVAPTSGHARFTIRGTQTASVEGTSSLDDTQWHDVLAVRQTGTLSIYVDGLLQAQAPALGTTGTANSRDFHVGKPSGNAGGGTGFTGQIDEVGIYAEGVDPVIIAGGTDCNHNGMDDALELAGGLGSDCNGNGVLDSCESQTIPGDCNANGICDLIEIAAGLVPDVNHDSVPDDCQPWTLLPYGLNSIVVLGDSLSDTGNLYLLSNGSRPLSPPNYQGRFSNGPVWCEYLAGYLGLDATRRYNFAFGGAASGDTNSLDNLYPGLPGLADEVEMYRQAALAGAAPAGPNTLYVVWIGPNDFNAFQQAGASIELDQVVHDAMDHIETALRELVQLGAHKILVPNMPDLGSTPLVRWNPNPELSAKARIATIGFNANLSALLARLESELGADFVYFDAFRFYDEILASPSQFGFTDISNPCWNDVAQTVCTDSSSHLFWDELHPTTAAHRWIGLRAQAAVLGGGDPLPELPCASTCPRGEVRIKSPLSGTFTLDNSMAVQGSVDLSGRRVGQVSLDVNGVVVPISSTGQFAALVPLDTGRIEQPILATLTAGDRVLDRERVVVLRGASIDPSTTIDDAVVAQLSTLGIGALIDELNGRLLTSGTLDIREHLLTHGPIASDYSGGFQYEVWATNAGFVCSSIDIVPGNGRLFVKINLHDLFVDYSFHGWSPAPDPGFDCTGRVTASRFAVFTELALHPTGGHAGRINVVQTQPLGFELLGFHHTGSCALAEQFIDLIPWVDFSVDQKIRNAISEKLGQLSNEDVLAEKLEEIVDDVSIATPLGGLLGVHVEGDITHINVTSAGARVAFSALLAALHGASGATYAVPYSNLPLSETNPATGEPCEFKVSIAVRELNQLLLALWPQFRAGTVLHDFDLGAGPQPLTAGRLSALVPGLASLGSTTPMEIRIRPTVPPMLLGQDGSGVTLSNLYVGQVLVDFVPTGGASSGAPVLSFALDLRGGVDLDIDAATGNLRASAHMAPGGVQASIVANRVGADEANLALLFDAVANTFVGSLSNLTGTIPMPEFEGLGIDLTNVQPENGYVTFVVDVDSSFSRPDLIVESLDPDVVHGSLTGRIKNVGTQTAYGSVSLGVSLSPDNIFMNGNDYGIGQWPIGLGNGLAPGESLSFIVNPAFPQPLFANQTLFALVDVPFLPGGTGAFCERSEGNNVLGVSVDATVPDASVTQVISPSDVIGGIGPRAYTVHVYRNPIGPDYLLVPVRVTIGSPAIYWADVMVNVPRGGEVVQDVWLNSPASFGTAGQSNSFPVMACANLAFDSNPANNCESTTVAIAVPWWDLRFDIVNAPASANHCSTTGWDVKVTNVGNVYSMNVCALTGIVLNSGAGNWSSNLGIANFTTPNVAPGASWTFHVNNYFVNCNALQTTQYIKAEVNYSAGCFDNYAAGNFKQTAIAIH